MAETPWDGWITGVDGMKETVTVRGPAGIDKDYAVVDSQKRILCECFGRVAEGPDGYVNAKYLADKIAEMMNEGYNQPEVEDCKHFDTRKGCGDKCLDNEKCDWEEKEDEAKNVETRRTS